MNYNNDKLLAAAFVKARGEIGATVGKDGKGNFGKYATLAAITEATSAALSKHGLAIIQEAGMTEEGVTIYTTLLHESGATMEFVPLPLPLTDRKPQAVGSAITYGRRYALAAICGLAPDDDDGQAAQDATRGAPAKATPAKAVDNPFEDAPPKRRASQEQQAEIDRLGALAYPGDWDANKNKLAEWASQGARKEIAALYELEAGKLIKALEKKVAA